MCGRIPGIQGRGKVTSSSCVESSRHTPGVGVMSGLPSAESSWLQSRSRACIWWCAVIDPVVSSNPHSGQGIRLISLTQYKSPTPVQFSTMACSNIPACNATGSQVILHNFSTLAAMPYLLNRPTRTLITCCSQSGSHKPTTPSSS